MSNNKDLAKELNDILDGKSSGDEHNASSLASNLDSMLSNNNNSLISAVNEGALIGSENFTLNESDNNDNNKEE